MKNTKKSKNPAMLISCAAILMIAVGAVIYLNQPKAQATTIFAMDTACDITLYNADSTDFEQCKARIKELDQALSAYSENSLIYQLNSGKTVTADETLKQIISKATQLGALYPESDCTCGALVELWDINGAGNKIPNQVDINAALATVGRDNIIISGDEYSLKNAARLNFGCCAKGYALDQIKSLWDIENISCGIISFGSSSLLYGQKPDKSKFTTAIRNPDNVNDTVLTVQTGQCFISTSGGYERYIEIEGEKYSHIFDLTTGYPAVTDLKSVTVISTVDGMLTDFLSTCIYIGGTQKLSQYLSDESYCIIAIDSSNKIHCSQSIENNISVTNADFTLTN